MVKIWTKMAFSIKKLRIIGSKKVPKKPPKISKKTGEKLEKTGGRRLKMLQNCYIKSVYHQKIGGYHQFSTSF